MTDAPVTTRFAPSPTGILHIGGARTALFNWLYARGRGGRFLLRIEDTDRARSTPEATRAIVDGLTWLGLDWDGEAVSQATRASRHREVAEAMLAAGTAYRCYATAGEIAEARERAKAEGRSTLFRSPWRDANPAEAPDRPFAIRLRAPRAGETAIEDQVQGRVAWASGDLDDMVLLRSDGTPTYMLAVVVDDQDMGVSHVIRGDDHLNNAIRQALIFDALGWARPVFAHIPLIHGPDGKKLSKRHGAVGLGEYRAMGYPASALRNYLARLGWSHGDDEVFSDEQAQAWFGFEGMNRAPAKLDVKKLDHVSQRHIETMDAGMLLRSIDDYLAALAAPPLSESQREALERALDLARSGVKTIPQLLEKANFILASRPVGRDAKAEKALAGPPRDMLSELTPRLQTATWTRKELERVAGTLAEERGVGLGRIAQPLRAALAGRAVSPSVFDMMMVLGREETLARIDDALT